MIEYILDSKLILMTFGVGGTIILFGITQPKKYKALENYMFIAFIFSYMLLWSFIVGVNELYDLSKQILPSDDTDRLLSLRREYLPDYLDAMICFTVMLMSFIIVFSCHQIFTSKNVDDSGE